MIGGVLRPLASMALAIVAFAASAQPYPVPPPPAAPRPFAIDPPSESRLDNGLRVIVARRAGVPIVSAALVALSGSEADPPRLAGLAALTASLLPQGTTKRKAPEIAAAAESLGGALEATAGWNQSTVTITVTTPKLDAALALVAEVTREPAFAADEIERIRTQTLDAMKVAWADPGTLATLVAARLVYGAGAYGHPSSGTPDSLPRIGRADLVDSHRRAWRPDASVLILAGDVTPSRGLALARKHFGRWSNPTTAAAAPASPSDTAAAAAGAGPVTAIVDMPKSGQAAVALDVALPARAPGEHAIGDVLNAVLGGGYTSRINAEIRIKRGLSYDARSSVQARDRGALFQVSVQTKDESAAEVVRLVDAELDRLVESPVENGELAARKATLIGNFSRVVETTAGLTAAIRSLVVSGRSPAELRTRIAAIEAVTAADVQRYAASHLGPARRRFAVAGDASSFASALVAARPAAVTVPQAMLDLDRGDGLVKR